MIPCSPPIAFCSTVGQASFHTACAIGPSTIERSKRRAAGAATGEPAGATPDVNGVEEASAADGAVADRLVDNSRHDSTGLRPVPAGPSTVFQRLSACS